MTPYDVYTFVHDDSEPNILAQTSGSLRDNHRRAGTTAGCCHAGDHEQQAEELLALEAIFAEAFTSLGAGRAEVTSFFFFPAVHSP